MKRVQIRNSRTVPEANMHPDVFSNDLGGVRVMATRVFQTSSLVLADSERLSQTNLSCLPKRRKKYKHFN